MTICANLDTTQGWSYIWDLPQIMWVYIIYVHINILMQRVTLNNIPFYQVVSMLFMLTTWAVEVFYILHQRWVIVGYKDNNKSWKSSETSILFTRSGGILNFSLHDLLLNLEMYSWDPLEILYLEGLKTSSRVPTTTSYHKYYYYHHKRW